MARIGLVHAYIQLEDGNLDPQTTKRCLRAADLFKNRELDVVYITVGTKKNNILMADKMEDFLSDLGVPRNAIVKIPYGFCTAEEIFACEMHIKPGDAVTSISSWYHLPRIWILWRVQGRKVALSASYGGAGVLNPLLEFPKLLFDVIVRPVGYLY